jgi:predicted nucleotidyltransferase
MQPEVAQGEWLQHLPLQKRQLLQTVAEQLSQVAGMAAVVLGGSYAGGSAHEGSDLDMGLYYEEGSPFSIADIRQIAERMANGAPPTVTNFYEWGAWVNGGAWIQTAQGKVDFLYRNLDQVQRTIDQAHHGIWHHDYGQQPTHGFYSVIYLAETQICLPLYDPAAQIAALKAQVAVYPSRLKQKILADTLWAAEFTLRFARDFAAQGDIYNTVGCMTRIVANLTQALFALNETYFLRDKRISESMARFSKLPPGYIGQIDRLLASPGGTAGALTSTVHALEACWKSVVSLEGVDYLPRF